jgi:uncharacterized membrane protein YeaQ/YmgE (transglycosylase-associated protein family)
MCSYKSQPTFLFLDALIFQKKIVLKTCAVIPVKIARVCKEKITKAPEERVIATFGFLGGFVGNIVCGIVGDFWGAFVLTIDSCLDGDKVEEMVSFLVGICVNEYVGPCVSFSTGICVITDPSSSATGGSVAGTDGVETKSDLVAPQGIGNRIEGSL